MIRPLKILIAPNPILEQVCHSEFIIPEWLIPGMFHLLRQHQGLGLAAPQVGINARLFVTKWGEVFVNPAIMYKSQSTMSQEWCLSFPGFSANKLRWLNIIVNGHRYQGTQAIVIQHELDHLNGITLETE